MKRWARGALAVLSVAMVCFSSSALASAAPSPSVAVARGIRELMGSGDHSTVAWDSRIGLWGGSTGPRWWQSAIAITTLVRYAERTHDRSPSIQRILVRTYQLNHYKPNALTGPNFTNQFMDDTAWWGLAWVAASQYELYDRHDRADAGRFLAVAEADAAYIGGRPRPCGGIEWSLNRAPDTTVNAEFVNLTAQLAAYRLAEGPFHDPQKASTWLGDARTDLAWLEGSGLVNLKRGSVFGFMSSWSCRLHGYPITQSEGEMADALVHMGRLLHQPAYYRQAAAFLRYTIGPSSGLMAHGVLQEHCQALVVNCAGNAKQLDVTADKGTFMAAVADWASATGSTALNRFVHHQAASILEHDVWGAHRSSRACSSPHSCQFGFSWRGGVPWTLVTVGTQESALEALIAAIR